MFLSGQYTLILSLILIRGSYSLYSPSTRLCLESHLTSCQSPQLNSFIDIFSDGVVSLVPFFVYCLLHLLNASYYLRIDVVIL